MRSIAPAITLTALLVVACGGTERQAFGTLPAPDVRQSGDGAGAAKGGGDPLFIGPPGGAITWSLGPDLALPDVASVYRLRHPQITAESVQEAARRLGIDGRVRPLTLVDGTIYGYEVASSEETCSPRPPEEAGISEEEYRQKYCQPDQRLELELDGSLFFGDGTVTLTAPSPPSVEQAETAAREWLRRSGLHGDDLVNISVREAPGGQPLREVVAELTSPANQVLNRPNIVVVVHGDGRVMQAYGDWAGIDAESSYRLRTPERLLVDLQELRGVFNHLRFLGEKPGHCGESACPPGILDPYRDFSAVVDSVDVGYTDAAAADGQAYLVPVYIVHGQLAQEGVTESVRFTTWVPAVDMAPSAQFEQAPNELFAVARTLLSPREAVLLSPPDEFTQVAGSERATGLFYEYVTVAEQTAEQIADSTRRELLARGWQPEEPPAIRSVDPSKAPGGEPPQPYSLVSSFVKEEARVAVLILEQPAWNPQGIAVDIVIEER